MRIMSFDARDQWCGELRKHLSQLVQQSTDSPAKIGIIGALGCHDVGDEAMLLSMMDLYKDWFPQAELTIFSIRPEVTENYIGIQAQQTLHRVFFNRGNLISWLMACIDAFEHLIWRILKKFFRVPETWCDGWALRMYFILLGAYTNWQTRRAVKGSSLFLLRSIRKHIQQLQNIDVLIFLGGGYINSWHVKARIYPYLTTAIAAKALGKPIVGSGLNLGPFNSFDRWMVGKALEKIELIGLRDFNESVSHLQAMNVSRDKIFFSSDDAISLRGSSLGDREVESLIANNQPYLAVQVHKWLLSTRGQLRLFELFARSIDSLVLRYGLNVIMLSMNFGSNNGDRACLSEIKCRCSHKNQIVVVEKDLLPQQLKLLFANAELTLCTRHHSLVFSVSAGVPTIVISFDQYYRTKLKGVSKEFADTSTILEFQNCAEDNVLSAADRHLKPRGTG